MIWHVTPNNDLREHADSSACDCHPYVEEMDNGDLLVVHTSWDGREAMEEVAEILGK